MKLFFIILLIGIQFSVLAQKNVTNSYNKRSIELNNRSIKLIFGPGDYNKKLKAANLLLDSAILIDPKYAIAYWNKIGNLISLREFKRAIRMTDSLESIKASKEGLFIKAVLNEKLGNKSAALKIYNKVLKQWEAEYVKKPSASILGNYAVAKKMVSGPDAAIKLIDSEKHRFNNNSKWSKNLEQIRKDLPKITVDKILNIH